MNRPAVQSYAEPKRKKPTVVVKSLSGVIYWGIEISVDWLYNENAFLKRAVLNWHCRYSVY